MDPTWQSDCGRVKLWQADCFDVLPDLCQAGCVTVTDPPYGTESGKVSTGYGRQQNYSNNGNGRTIIGDATTETISKFLKSIRTKRCAMFLSPRNWRQVDQLIEEHGWEDEAWMVWDKTIPGLGFPVQFAHELIAVLHKDNRTLEKATISVLSYYSEARANATRNHPHQKPRALMTKLVGLYFEKTVIDPFMGSGTTALAALDNHKQFLGIEKDREWFDFSVQRIQTELKQLALFKGSPQHKQTELV